MAQKILLKRGLRANLPTLSIGEFGFCTDTKELFIGSNNGNVQIHPVDQSGGSVSVTSGTNGTIIVNGQEINVYTHPTSHSISEVSGLQTALDGKASTDHIHEISQINGLQAALNNVSSGGVLKFQTVTELQSAYPNGTTDPVWIVSENSWYYWEGTVTTPTDTTAPTVTASPNGGTYTSTQTVTLSSETGATIYYTTNGSTPTTSSSVYSSPITVNNTTTLKFFAKDTAGNSSTVQTVTFTINVPDTTDPVVTVNPAGGTYTGTRSVTLTTNETATVYYTLDGSTPTESSSVYSTALSISASTTLKYFAKDSAGNTSDVQTQSYVITAPDSTAPNEVTGLGVTSVNDNSITVNWIASSSSDIESYDVEITELGTIVDETPPVEAQSLTVQSYTDTSITVSWSPSPSDDVASYDIEITEI